MDREEIHDGFAEPRLTTLQPMPARNRHMRKVAKLGESAPTARPAAPISRPPSRLGRAPSQSASRPSGNERRSPPK
jgi:hypothetical protein